VAGPIAVTTPIIVNVVDPGAVGNPDPRVIEEVLVLKAAQARREAREAANRGDFGGAADRLKRTSAALRDAAASSPAPDRLLGHAAALDEAVLTLDAGTYSAPVSKQLLYDARAASQNRPTRTARRPKRPTADGESSR
jgi:hypothetical protein